MWMWTYVLVACGGLGWALNSWEIPQGRLEDLVSPELDDRWILFKKFHNRTYNGDNEELTRRIYWEDAVRYISRHNEKYDRGESTYFMGETQFADLADDEYLKMFNSGLKLPEQGDEEYPEPLMEPLPESLGSIDWRQRGKVSPIQNQGSCGSCWAFSAVAVIESLDAIKTGRMGPRLSEQNLVDCTRNYGNHGCHGGWMNSAFKYLMKTNGINTAKCYPYAARDQRCQYLTTKSCLGPKVRSYSNVGKSESSLDRALSTFGPVAMAMDTSPRSFGYYKGGVYYEPACNPNRPTHAMAAVGYESQYYIIKNSWGTHWGESGFLRIRRGDDRCGVSKWASYPLL